MGVEWVKVGEKAGSAAVTAKRELADNAKRGGSLPLYQWLLHALIRFISSRLTTRLPSVWAPCLTTVLCSPFWNFIILKLYRFIYDCFKHTVQNYYSSSQIGLKLMLLPCNFFNFSQISYTPSVADPEVVGGGGGAKGDSRPSQIINQHTGTDF